MEPYKSRTYNRKKKLFELFTKFTLIAWQPDIVNK